jgi:hypothetical protein
MLKGLGPEAAPAAKAGPGVSGQYHFPQFAKTGCAARERGWAKRFPIPKDCEPPCVSRSGPCCGNMYYPYGRPGRLIAGIDITEATGLLPVPCQSD